MFLYPRFAFGFSYKIDICQLYKMQKSENAIEFRVKLWYNICARDRVNLLKEGISMKKALVLIMILLVAICIVACGTTTPAETTGADTTAPAVTTGTPDGTTPTTTTKTVVTNSDPAVVTTVPAGEKLETEDYTAILNGDEWVKSEVDTSKFDIFGTGVSAVTKINSTYGGYKKNYTIVNADGTKTEASNSDVRKLATIGITVKEDKANKVVDLEVHEVEIKVQPSWSHVTAKAGSYLMFKFTTNIPIDFAVTVTAKEGGSSSSAADKQNGITVTGSNGTYTGTAKCQVPYAAGNTMYINICPDGSAPTAIVSIPVVITQMKYESPFKLKFVGDWELVKREDYLSDLVDLFYNVYPRLYERFGLNDPNVPETITFKADKSYDGVAYNAGDLVCVATDYANSSPYDIGFFAHEITHAVQQYGGKMCYDTTSTYRDPETGKTYTVASWWTEFMADLGHFRYFHWGYSSKFCKFYSMSDPAIRDFGYQSYGQHNIFSAYIDDVYGSRKNADGTVTLGLMDSMNKLIKESKTLLYDNPYDPNSPFNKTVKAVTGHATLEEVRLEFVKALDEGTWAFKGYANYQDNFLTEDIPNIPNPEYPMNEPVKKGDKTATALETPVTEGNNIAKGATIVSASSQGGSRNPVENLLDGDLGTMFQGAKVTDDYKYELGGYKHEFVIDLGAVKTFDTYTIANAGSKSSNKNNNTSEWEIFVSEDGKTWTSVDYQSGNKADIASFNIGDTFARYVKLRVFTTDQSANVGTVRLYEFMLFDQQ